MSATTIDQPTSAANNIHAAEVDDQKLDAITPYQVIMLLLNGALERVDQAMTQINAGDSEEAFVLIQKAIGIVSGLRENLDLNKGGDIAVNLDALYEYITVRLEDITVESQTPLATLREVKNLLQEVHTGWTGISSSV